MKAILTRQSANSKQTIGTLELFAACGQLLMSCKTLELPWLNNARQKSCIPKGNYKVVARTSPKYGLHFFVTNVPGRDMILIHHGNYHTDILGCILVGAAHTDINGDKLPDVTSSKVTMQKLTKLAPQGFELTIR
ncbi:MAG: hypothetical protein ITG00_03390 [Flavobacterium sp.]|nr:hypothetical protein [Flavobacterium sp.]